jgi:hydrogenase maturation protein HypF
VAGQVIRKAVRVQGAGFRPFVYSLATGLGLGGLAGNDTDGVFAEIEGEPTAVGEFLRLLEEKAPPLARVTAISLPAEGTGSFRIVAAADTATCEDCLRELRDPADRRFRYPFINCTNCGPRFTIVRGMPYDRPLTTMADFAMCERCSAEYHDPAGRRFHAQPVCCPACGPRLALLEVGGTVLLAGALQDDPLEGTATLLRNGAVVAVKGLGGYHLAADAGCERAVVALRARKHREDKPFAVLAADLAAARRLCEVDAAGAALLTGQARPTAG